MNEILSKGDSEQCKVNYIDEDCYKIKRVKSKADMLKDISKNRNREKNQKYKRQKKERTKERNIKARKERNI